MLRPRSSNWYFAIIFCSLSNILIGQTTIILESIPASTPEGDKIFISGDFEGWTGGQKPYELEFSEGHYKIVLPAQLKSISFKFTRGSWDEVEADQNGSQIENRNLDLSEKKQTLYYSIENWANFIETKSTTTANVETLSDAFEMPNLGKQRRIWVYLPPNYHESNERYPVLYMQDGQNLFDAKTSYSGEWEVDEALDALFDEKGIKIIVIGIDNAGEQRIDEYTPWKLKGYKSIQKGEAYINFISQTLKPFVDENYRTLNGRQNNGIMGSSLGGLISHYAVLKYPETFGFAGVFSPSFEMAPESFQFTQNHSQQKSSRIYYMAGDSESEQMDSLMVKMVDQMKASGFPSANIKSKVVTGGKHNEKLWRGEFKEAITWLFEKYPK